MGGQSNRVLRATAPGYGNAYIRTNRRYSDSTHSMNVGPRDGWTRAYVGGGYNRNTINGGGRFNYGWIDFLHINGHGQGQGCNRWLWVMVLMTAMLARITTAASTRAAIAAIIEKS